MRRKLLGMVGLALLVLGWGGSVPPGAPANAAVGARPAAPEAAAPAVCTAVFSEDFESGTLGQFVATIDPYAYWRPTSPGHAGSCCAAVAPAGEICCAETAPGRTLPQGGTSPDSAPGAAPRSYPFDEIMTTRNPFTIPATASSASLSFWWQSLFFPSYEWLRVEVSPDGVNWTALWEGDNTTPNWTLVVLDLTAYRGQSVLLRFHFNSTWDFDDNWATVDDIVVDAILPGCATPTPGPTQTPSRTPTATPTYVEHAGQFEDVPPGSTFYEFVECMGTRGIISGYPCGGVGEPCHAQHKPYFRPNANVTRGQVSKMVVSAAGWNDPVPSTQQTFEDVPPGSTFWLWIEQLAGRGIIGGYPCGGPFEPCQPPLNRAYFRPNNNLTRGQLAKIAAQAAAFTETPTAQTFEDVPSSSTFYLWIERMASRGIVGGYPCGGLGEPCISPGNRPYYRPNGNVTRGQTAKIITSSFFPNCQTPPTLTPTLTPTPTGPPATEPPTATVTPTGPPAPPTATATP